MNDDSILAVRGLVKDFGRRRVLHGIDFEIEPGEVVGLLGPNGSGKSTTLHCITGFHRATGGDITMDGYPHESTAAKNLFGFFPDDLPIPESLTGRETISFHRRLRPEFDAAFADDLVDVLGLKDHLDKYVGDYSHGMRRKIQLVLTLAHHPRLLILDEPLRGLDPEAGALMNAVIASFADSGGGVLVATHDLLAAQHFCDRVVVVADGHVAAAGTPKQVSATFDAPDLEAAFIAATGLQGRVEQARHTITRIIAAPTLVG